MLLLGYGKKMSILNDKNGQNDLNGIFIFNINIVE
jgi:hypothetical protein